ncbi:amino acid deaminase/aldolase [Paenibacillus yanchengensis]|uniref:Amino acid deaminase/aldolase n=1 Tax=Paenibacillus yanchengensis TaxID=2035833 RepID=A0ABW4YQ97_9BACL
MISLPDYEQYKRTFAHTARPFAYVNLDLLDENIRQIAAAAGDKTIRVASKSIRSVPVMSRIFAASDVFKGVMCYSAREALFLLQHGFDDLLLGYPVYNATEIYELLMASKDLYTVTFMVDSMDHLHLLAKQAKKAAVVANICLDIDMSTSYPGLHFGVHRSPLTSWAQTEPLVQEILHNHYIHLDGIMGYEAQIAGLGDNVASQKMKSAVIRFLKTRSVQTVARRRSEILTGLNQLGVNLRFVNAGGTGSLASSRLEAGVTEITAGSGFFSPTLFDHYRGFQYFPAAGYAIEVVRKPSAHMVTCLGGGYTASGVAGPDKAPSIHLPQGIKMIGTEGAGEVQTPLKVPAGLQLNIGDPIFLRHAKAGELCERFTKLYAISDGEIVDELVTYRGEGECFL